MRLVVMLGLLPTLLAPAMSVLAAEDSRAALAAQRAQIELQSEQALAACRQRFDVTSCELQARRERSAALAPVRSRELELDAQERQARAQQQRERVQVKQLEAQAQDNERRLQAAVQASPASASASSARPALIKPAGQGQRLSEAERRQAAQQRALQADEATQRQRQRLEKGERELADRQVRHAQRLSKAAAAQASAPSGAASKPVLPLATPAPADIAALKAAAASAASSRPRP